jgi:RNA polymerase-interacting CarD/CdnL/TRCF family regulator
MAKATNSTKPAKSGSSSKTSKPAALSKSTRTTKTASTGKTKSSGKTPSGKTAAESRSFSSAKTFSPEKSSSTPNKGNKITTKLKTSAPETKFKINQKVVYPSQGVGKVTDITEQVFKEQRLWYYNIYIEASDMVVMVPVDRAEELGIRAIVSSEEAEQALDLLSDDFEPITSDWKLRYQMNLDLLKKGSIMDIATIVRCLYNRSKVKELPILERKLYDSARKLLEDEISFAMGKTAKEVESLIHTKLEPPGSAPKIKHIVSIDDDEDDNLMDDMEDKSADTSGHDDDEETEETEEESPSDSEDDSANDSEDNTDSFDTDTF